MSNLQLNAHVPANEHACVVKEAQDLGVSTHDYVKQIILQRGSKTIQLANSDAAVIQARLEGKIEILTEQNAALQREVALANEKSGLNGIEAKGKSTEKIVAEAMAKKDAEYELKNLHTEIKDLTEERDELEKERNELKAIVDSNTRMDRMMEKGTQILEVAGRIAPVPVNKIINGLAGLFGGGDDSGLSGSLAPEQQLALNAGQAIMQDIDAGSRESVVDILQYMAAHPITIGQIQKTKGFLNWKNAQQ